MSAWLPSQSGSCCWAHGPPNLQTTKLFRSFPLSLSLGHGRPKRWIPYCIGTTTLSLGGNPPCCDTHFGWYSWYHRTDGRSYPGDAGVSCCTDTSKRLGRQVTIKFLIAWELLLGGCNLKDGYIDVQFPCPQGLSGEPACFLFVVFLFLFFLSCFLSLNITIPQS